jgi:ubiquinone/menaquinone biosynthesis C-methylase UbiE
MKKEQKTSWGDVSHWYDGVVNDDDSYQQKVILPNLIRVLNLQKTDDLLDIACGQGLFSHETAKSVSHVTGFDIGKDLVALANKRASKNEKFLVASADGAFPFVTGQFDKAFCVLALQNIKNLDNVLRETSRVLKEGGKFVLVLNHPAFRIPKHSDWGFDEEKKAQYRKVFEYMSEKTVPIDMNPGKKHSTQTVSFHRPLQVYFKTFAKNGFAVTRLEEWVSHKESQLGPRKTIEDKARKEIPLFMCLEVKKQN